MTDARKQDETASKLPAGTTCDQSVGDGCFRAGLRRAAVNPICSRFDHLFGEAQRVQVRDALPGLDAHGAGLRQPFRGARAETAVGVVDKRALKRHVPHSHEPNSTQHIKHGLVQ